MRKSLSLFNTASLCLLISMISFTASSYAVTYPVGVPSGEVAGGTFNTYFSNMFTTVGLTESSPSYVSGCAVGEVMRGLSSSGMLLCISPGLGSTSSATLSLSGSLIGTPNYVAKYTPTGTGINNSQIYDNGTNVGIANISPTYKLDVAGSGSFYGLRVSSGATNGYVLTSDASGIATWRATGYPCFPTGTGIDNVCYGSLVLQANTTGFSNTANGHAALRNNTTGYNNSAFGHTTLQVNTTGLQNTAIGSHVLTNNINGSNNTAVGVESMQANISGSNNTVGGYQALPANVTGNANTVFGYFAGQNLTSGDNNTALGSNTNFNSTTGSNQMNIANIIFGTGLTGTVGAPVGNVGIGIANPTAKLEIAGQIKITGGGMGSGKVLTSDANGLARWADTVSGSTATGIVSGAGNQNYLSKFGPGGVGIYSSQLYDDATNVGIGTITPGAKLEVAGQIKITGGAPGVNKVLSSDATGLATWVSLSSVSGVWSILGNTGTVAGTNFIGTTDAQDLVFKTNNAETARILSTGNMGIGTATPGARLEIAGQVKITGGGIGSGKVLTSDATGLATWTTAPSPCIPAGTGTSNICYGASALQLNTAGGMNTAVGVAALSSNTTASWNTAVGFNSLATNTTGGSNTANGNYALRYNTTGSSNTANGTNALYTNATGSENTAIGVDSLTNNTFGNANTANGWRALSFNTNGNNNTALGYLAGSSLITGNSNIFIGYNTQPNIGTGASNQLNIGNWIYGNSGSIGIGVLNPTAKLEVAGQVKITGGGIGSGKVLTSDATGLATWTTAPSPCIPSGTGANNTCYGVGVLQVNASGFQNTGNGFNALFSNTSGRDNAALGYRSLQANTTGSYNTANGSEALRSNTSGNYNSANGMNALFYNTTGSNNTANGMQALVNNATGSNNTANGMYALLANMGDNNTAIGSQAGFTLVSGNSNIFIGYNTQPNIGTGASNQLNIGNWIYGNSGSIGIGVLNPTAKLEVAGQVRITGGTPGVGKILTSDATGLAVWSDIASGSTATGIVGGTQNYISKFGTGGVGIYVSQLFDNGTNVGIGTAIPGAKLEVAGQVKITGGAPGVGKILTSDATGLAVWSNTPTLTNTWNIIGNSGTIAGTNFLGTADNQPLVFKTNNAENIRILTSGDVGIGTPTPGSKLEVAGQVKITGGIPGLGKVLTSDATGLAVWSNSISGATATGITGGTQNYVPKFGTGGTGLYLSQFFDNGTNVGIGTATPGAKLEVAGQVRIATAGAYLDYRPNAVSCTNGQILSWNNASTRWECSSNAPGISGSGLTTNYVTKWNGTSIANSQLFDNGTNVGIGTATPGSKLEVAGNSYFNGNVTVSGSLIVDKIVNRTVNNVSISGSLLPDSVAPLAYRDIGSAAQRWNNLYLSGQVTIAGGVPGLGKVLTSDANGLAVWSNSLSGATATGITGGTQNYLSKFGTGGTGLYLSQFFDNGTNVGIGTATPGAKLEVAGQVKITGGVPGLGKILTSDATGLAVWSSSISGATATGITGGTQNYVPKFGTGGTGLYLSQFFDNGTNVGIGTTSPTTKLTIDSGITGSGGLRLSRISATTTPYAGANVGLGVDGSGNIVPVSNGDVVVYTARGRNSTQPVPDPDLPNRLIGYNFNTYFAIPTSQSFVVSDGNGAGYNAPYFKENGTSGICSGGGSPYDCAIADPVTGLSASPNNSFTMTAKGSTYGYQMALGARGDAPLFARSGRFTGAQTNGLFLSDGTTPTPWQKVLTVPANHVEYFYVNIGYNSQLQAIAGGGNVGIGTSFPDRRLVISSSGSATSATQQVQIRRGIQGADASLGNTYGTPYMNIGGQENRVNSLQTIGFGKSLLGAAGYAPAEIGFLTTSTTGNTQGDIVFANRNGTTNVVPTEVMRIESTGDVGIGVTNPTQQLQLSRSMSMPATTGASTGVIYKGAARFIHNYTSSALSPNLFMGLNAGNFTMTQGYNIGIGDSALALNTSGFSNMALGYLALANNTTGGNNAAIGSDALELNQTGNNNVANGFKSLYANLTGGNNTSIGTEALTTNNIGSNNTANGYQAMNANTSGNFNTAIGGQSLFTNISGQNNTAVGYQALRVANSPSNNTALGYLAGNAITTGASNIVIGANAQVASPTGSNQLSIGNWLYGSGGNIGIGVATPVAKLEVAGNFKLGTNGTVTTAAGVCTIASTAISTTATTYTCTGVPASTAVAIHCNAAAAFTTPNTTSLYCRTNGTLNQVVCNTTVANSVSTTYKCMWMQ